MSAAFEALGITSEDLDDAWEFKTDWVEGVERSFVRIVLRDGRQFIHVMDICGGGNAVITLAEDRRTFDEDFRGRYPELI